LIVTEFLSGIESGMPHVLSAALAYAYSEKELAHARDRIEMCSDAVPESLKG